MKIQKVVRTISTSDRYKYDYNTIKYLDSLLNEGYVVVMCTPIGNDLEYIVEKEVEDK